jgi:hypothetical protein
MCPFSYNTGPCIILAVMCIYVIYKCLSWEGGGGDQQKALGKPRLKIAKQSHQWGCCRGPISRGE